MNNTNKYFIVDGKKYIFRCCHTMMPEIMVCEDEDGNEIHFDYREGELVVDDRKQE